MNRELEPCEVCATPVVAMPSDPVQVLTASLLLAVPEDGSPRMVGRQDVLPTADGLVASTPFYEVQLSTETELNWRLCGPRVLLHAVWVPHTPGRCRERAAQRR